jgi:hypothetical protein
MSEPRQMLQYSLDPSKAPITHGLAMNFQMMDNEIAEAAPADRLDVALNQMYIFLGHLIPVIHQLETGESPELLGISEE